MLPPHHHSPPHPTSHHPSPERQCLELLLVPPHEAPQDLGQLIPLVLRQPLDLPKVDQADAAVGHQEEVARVGVRVEETVDQDLEYMTRGARFAYTECSYTVLRVLAHSHWGTTHALTPHLVPHDLHEHIQSHPPSHSHPHSSPGVP